MFNYKQHPAVFTPVVNPEELLKRLGHENREPFELYRNGAELHVWRNSSPHNWWLSSPGDRNDILYHWSGWAHPTEAFIAFARRLGSNGQKVSYGSFFSGADAGRNVQDAWVYDEEVYKACIVRWEQAVECAKQFNTLAGTRSVDLVGLSHEEAQLLRGLKRGGSYPMIKAHIASYEKLCAMGLAEVTPRGYLQSTSFLRSMPLPSAANWPTMMAAA